MSDDAKKLGPTGEFPEERLCELDQGELQLSVGSGRYNGILAVRLEFGTACKWIGMPPAGARELARLLLHHAERLEGLVSEERAN